ncbi:MAG TPA: cysteine--tRNA ligase [Ignavibacteria bacterium]|nr:cysteine--tRNA ligase [Ignavibacteria bacterium]HMR40091.1 cysteine--tRNA ligase [Ignavibacteria bacterium]
MLKLYNTLSRAKEEFTPIEEGKVRMYSCGPTVYHYMHIGNLRTFFFEDILLRVLKYNGYAVKYVMNITDVGHLVADSDEGDDKMEESAKKQGKTVWEVAEYYTKAFKNDVIRLNIFPPDLYTKATDYIQQQIDMVKCLEDKGYTYKTKDGIYYDTSKFPDYGKLARLDIKGLQEGARVEYSSEKKNITDFALWKFSPENEKRQMEWESPWGKGFPGWHIECSAMSKAELGTHFDIHCSAVDHIPIHHTNEIAQSEACSGEKSVNYWVHGEHLDMGNDKMSKSLGNFVTLQMLIDKGYSAMDYRYFLLMAHYKKKLKFSFEAMDAAKSGLKNLKGKVSKIILESSGQEINTEINNSDNFKNYKNRFLQSINDDLNMPEAMAVMWDMLKDEKLTSAEKAVLALDFDKIFGLKLDEPVQENGLTEIPDDIRELVNKRAEAKKNKDFKLSDEIRDQIKEKGYEILDKKDGVEIKKISL